MKISIVIPTYNRAKFIVETLNSVASQTSDDWECIIVDDHSTDNTDEIVDHFLLTHNNLNFRYLKNEKSKGAQGARNTGIEHALYDWLFFLDSDDLMDANFVAHRLHEVRAHPLYDLYAFTVRIFHKKMGDSPFIWNYVHKEGIHVLDRFLVHDSPFQTLGCIWKKDVFSKVGVWDEQVTSLQDWEMHFRALVNPEIHIFYSKDIHPDCSYRMDNYASISKTFTTKQGAKNNIYLVNKVFSLLQSHHCLEQHLPAFLIFVWDMYTMIAIADYKMANEMIKVYLPYYKMNTIKLTVYKVFFKYRFNYQKPRFLRALMSLIPKFYPLTAPSPIKCTTKNVVIGC